MKWYWVAAWLAAAVMFWGFWSYGLFDLDEGLYAAALSEMNRAGEWILISYRGEPFFEKPILMYWFGLAFTKLGVPGVAALRLASVLAAFGTLWVVVRFVRSHFREQTAFHSFLALATCVWMLALGRMFTPDMLLVFAMSASLFALYNSLLHGWKWRVVSLVLLGVAVLAKGPMPVAIYLVVLTYMRFTLRTEPFLWRGGWLIGIVCFLGVVGTWYLPVALKGGAPFFQEFILNQNLGRFAGGDKAHLGPIYYYVPVLLVSFLPLSPLMFAGFRRRQRTSAERFLIVWAFSVLVLFSLSGSKLPHYILPAMPPLAILLAIWTKDSSRWMVFATACFAALILIAVSVAALQPIVPVDLRGVAIGASVGSLLMLLAVVRKAHVQVQCFAFALPLMIATLQTLPKDWWSRTHSDSFEAAMFLRGRPEKIIEYRTGGEGKFGETAHPSMQWVMGKATYPIERLGDLRGFASFDYLVLTRHRRLQLDLDANRTSLPQFDLIKDFGSFQVLAPSK